MTYARVRYKRCPWAKLYVLCEVETWGVGTLSRCQLARGPRPWNGSSSSSSSPPPLGPPLTKIR